MKAKPTGHPGEILLALDRRDESLLAEASRTGPESPFQLKKILVPIDFSNCSKKALQYAIPLAQQHQAALTLLYVVPNNYAIGEYGGFDYASLEEEMRASGERQLAELSVDAVQGRVEADAAIRIGSAGVEIVEAAKAEPADLIVISTHGHTGLKHVLLGSVAEYVVRRAPCPVLVVREHEREFVAG